jgi:integrase
MSSLWKDPRTNYQVACFTAFEGKRLVQLKKSTGTVDKETAKLIAIKLEDAGQGRLSPEQAKEFLASLADLRSRRATHRALSDVLKRATGRGMESRTIKGFVADWLATTRSEVSPATAAKYDQTSRLFLESLGGKAGHDLETLTRADVSAFRDAQLQRVAATTANLSLKIVRVMLGKAEADGFVMRNEAKFVKGAKATKRSSRQTRRAFTLPELKRVLDVCDPEWRSLVLFGFYTGQRLGDLADLTWQNLDLTAGELRLATIKNDKSIVLPLAAPLRQHIETLPAGDDPKQPLHPRAFAVIQQQGRVGMLSRQFGEILAAAGLVKARTHHTEEKNRKGRGARRTQSAVSFHCLRHTAVSLLKNAGVSDAVAQDLVGHESAEISRLYTHIEDATKRAAVDKLPVIG